MNKGLTARAAVVVFLVSLSACIPIKSKFKRSPDQLAAAVSRPSPKISDGEVNP